MKCKSPVDKFYSRVQDILTKTHCGTFIKKDLMMRILHQNIIIIQSRFNNQTRWVLEEIFIMPKLLDKSPDLVGRKEGKKE